jgi:hypothetical protein
VLVDGAHAGYVGGDVGYDVSWVVEGAEAGAGEGEQGLDVVLVCYGVDFDEQGGEVGCGDVGCESGGEGEVVEVVD